LKEKGKKFRTKLNRDKKRENRFDKDKTKKKNGKCK